ncbi:hypothetical protein DFH11DRAFT_1620454 [Phellopilus nigrolimitatus]|nr:hypothetical protein DFH11DRAFT_1620454 [Phellopilus nigrolimitatus]
MFPPVFFLSLCLPCVARWFSLLYSVFSQRLSAQLFVIYNILLLVVHSLGVLSQAVSRTFIRGQA